MSTRRFKRKLTPFLCQEMLYDYAIGNLDTERRQAIDEFLPTDAESQRILRAIKKGLVYSEQLAQFKVSDEILNRLFETENIISIHRALAAAQKIPRPPMKVVTSALGIIFLAGALAALPWGEIFKSHSAKTTVSFALPAATPSPEENAPTAENEGRPGLASPPAVDASEGDDSGDATESPDVKAAVVPHAKGFVYRAFMTLDNVDDVADEITKKIQDEGGTKAGEVELGWKKGAGRYYHFALPEDNEEKLLNELRAYGPVRISKDPHPRIMPKGQVRFILWIDAGK